MCAPCFCRKSRPIIALNDRVGTTRNVIWNCILPMYTGNVSCPTTVSLEWSPKIQYPGSCGSRFAVLKLILLIKSTCKYDVEAPVSTRDVIVISCMVMGKQLRLRSSISDEFSVCDSVGVCICCNVC